MSTNDGGWGNLPPGVPDPEVLARMAAEFFGPAPQRLGPARNASPQAAPAVPGAGAFDSAAGPSFSFLQDARPLFSAPTVPVKPAEAGGPNTPAVPTGLGSLDSAFPTFSFL